MKKILVAYFSASGITAKVAKDLSSVLGADLYEIQPKTPYTDADLSWTDSTSRTSLESKDPACRPAIVENDAHISDYDTVFLGFPIWWYAAPHIVKTFLEAYDFSGKTIVVFATSGGSKFGNTIPFLKGSCSDDVTWIQGEILNGNPPLGKLTEWINRLKL